MKTKTLFLLFLFLLKTPVFAQNIDYYLNRADKKMVSNDYQGALEVLQRGTELFPNDALLYYKMSTCQKKLGNYLSATKIYAYAKALESRKDNALIDGTLKITRFFSH